jgi:TnpA family transposase
MDKKMSGLSDEALLLIASKKGPENQIVFGVLLAFFQQTGRFPNKEDRPCTNFMCEFSNLLNLKGENNKDHLTKIMNSSSRTVKRFKNEIRSFCQFKDFNKTNLADFIVHCKTVIFPTAPTGEQALEQAYAYLKSQKIEPYSEKQINRFLTTAHHQFESEFFEEISRVLSPHTKKELDKLVPIDEPKQSPNAAPKAPSSRDDTNPITLAHLKSHQVELKIASILHEIQKYKYLKLLEISSFVELIGTRKLLFKYYERVLADPLSSLKRYKVPLRHAYLAIFCVIRQQIMTDTLTDLLLKLFHRILTKAEYAVDKALRLDNKRVKGKMGTLLILAKKSIDNPSGIIEDTIYPIVSKDRLGEIVSDLGDDSQWYRNQIKAKALSLYSHNNRRIVWALMEVLDLQTESKLSKILLALKFVKKIHKTESPLKDRLYYPGFLKNTISSQWLPFVQDKTAHPIKVKINWHAFEMALFEILETALSVKNIWVNLSFRYRNPQKDLPADFDENEDYYFDLLGLPKDVNVFIHNLKQRVDSSLSDLNSSILDNPKVSIKDRKKKGAIKITPFDPQPEPQHLELLKMEIARRWPDLQLIDVLKEADFRTGFTKRFESVASRETLNEPVLKKRLLLNIYGIGSNTGLKRVSGFGEGQELIETLRYVKRRFINCQNVRFAIQDLVNAIHKLRDPKTWGISTTSCSSDSKKVSVWDQNLLVEWHARYGGRGVMIYWHVDKKGLCIHSRLKTCSSSEVGAMIQGILHHDTDMNIREISVDTHGQSMIGFGFSELFQFDLLPRIKNINKQKLYCSSKTKKGEYPNLTDALASETIHWNTIHQHYRDAVRHAVALKIRTVDPDVMMRRLSADNKENSVYQALTEIGKAARTIFLCRYLSFEPLRIDIHESLNVVERVNSIMGFIFYGRLGEISTNNTEDQELSLLCLHLIEVSMVYINTILIQIVLSDPQWASLLTPEDRRALSPLFHGHINPYGFLSLNMDVRLDIDPPLLKVKAHE